VPAAARVVDGEPSVYRGSWRGKDDKRRGTINTYRLKKRMKVAGKPSVEGACVKPLVPASRDERGAGTQGKKTLRGEPRLLPQNKEENVHVPMCKEKWDSLHKGGPPGGDKGARSS